MFVLEYEVGIILLLFGIVNLGYMIVMNCMNMIGWLNEWRLLLRIFKLN